MPTINANNINKNLNSDINPFWERDKELICGGCNQPKIYLMYDDGPIKTKDPFTLEYYGLGWWLCTSKECQATDSVEEIYLGYDYDPEN